MQTNPPPGATSAGRRPAPLPLLEPSRLPETVGYRIKNRLLGPPLTTEELHEQRLSKVAALGVLSPDCISSTAYGSEEMLRILVPAVGVAAFSLLLPVTAAVIVVLFFVTLSYREVVMAYTRTGGAYMVSRENFGPRVAQVAAAALIIDYCVTVAVQVAAGTDAVISALPGLKSIPDVAVILSVAVVLGMCLANLRGIREASKVFVAPTYFFIVSMGAMVVVGLVRAAFGQLHEHGIHVSGAIGAPASHGSGLLLGASVFVLLRSFANGGSSLTGLEAISNGVSAFRPPTGNNARRTLVVMSVCLGSLVCGVSLLAHVTHAVPYVSGYPTVVSQEAGYVFGRTGLASVLYYVVVVANVAILWTGGNTSFSGFPFLTSFVAADSFLPRWMSKRGHRLAFSNGIIVLTALGIALLVATGANVDSLVSLYAIGVFTGFTMAGAGMVRYHRRTRERGWQRRQLVNGFAAVLTASVVVIFAVTKFTSGAWVVVVLFPVLVVWFIRINRRYRQEQKILEVSTARMARQAPPMRRHAVVLLVDRLDVATVAGVRYARALLPDTLRVVHFRTDPQQTRELEQAWRERGLSQLPLEILDCPDRRVGRATLDLVGAYLDGDTQVSVLLPRRDFGGVAAWMLHDRTADRIAVILSEVRNVNAIIVPFQLSERGAVRRLAGAAERPAPQEEAATSPRSPGDRRTRGKPEQDVPGRFPICDLHYRQRGKVAGVIKSVEIQPRDGIQVLTARLEDETGGISLVFGRGRVDGLEPSARVSAEGMVGEYEGSLAIRNPLVEVLVRPTSESGD